MEHASTGSSTVTAVATTSAMFAAITKWRNDGSVRTTHHYYEGLRIEPVRRRLAG